MIIWTQLAKEDLKAIFHYFKQNVSYAKALEIIDNIFDKLEVFNSEDLNTDLTGQQELDLVHLKQNHRYLVKGNYKIIYITHVFDTRQDPAMKNRN